MRQLSRPLAPSASAARSRAVARTWRCGPAQRRLADAFADAPEDAEAVMRRAARLFRDVSWVDALLGPLIGELAADPWFEPPLKAHSDGLRCAAVLFESPAVTVSLSVLSAERFRLLPPPATVAFSGRLSVTRYLRAGAARVRRWAAPPVPGVLTAVDMSACRRLRGRTLKDDAIVWQDGRTRAQAITAASSDVVALTATARTGGDSVSREYDVATGAFLRMATTDEGAARAQVLLSLLRASGAAGADRCFDAATRDGAFFLRWSAMREWLAHDWRAAWGRVAEMAADDPHPEVRAAAADTLARLTRQAA